MAPSEETGVVLPTLRGRRVVLRRVLERDTHDRLAAGNDAEAVRMASGDHRNLKAFTPEDAQRWYQFHRQELYAWVAEFEGQCIGGARLHGVNMADQRARFAIGIFVPGMRNRGIGTEMTRLVLRYAFEELKLHRVDLRVLEHNHRAIAGYAKCGFVREGIERGSALVADEWHDDVMMSILEHKYQVVSRRW